MVFVGIRIASYSLPYAQSHNLEEETKYANIAYFMLVRNKQVCIFSPIFLWLSSVLLRWPGLIADILCPLVST